MPPGQYNMCIISKAESVRIRTRVHNVIQNTDLISRYWVGIWKTSRCENRRWYTAVVHLVASVPSTHTNGSCDCGFGKPRTVSIRRAKWKQCWRGSGKKCGRRLFIHPSSSSLHGFAQKSMKPLNIQCRRMERGQSCTLLHTHRPRRSHTNSIRLPTPPITTEVDTAWRTHKDSEPSTYGTSAAKQAHLVNHGLKELHRQSCAGPRHHQRSFAVNGRAFQNLRTPRIVGSTFRHVGS